MDDQVRTAFDSLALYPRWFVALCTTLALALVVWVLGKILKWTIYLAVGAVLVLGAAVTIWLALA